MVRHPAVALFSCSGDGFPLCSAYVVTFPPSIGLQTLSKVVVESMDEISGTSRHLLKLSFAENDAHHVITESPVRLECRFIEKLVRGRVVREGTILRATA